MYNYSVYFKIGANMKKFNSFKLMFTFAGCFLGAGYVSGQELWQFFGSFGRYGVIGIVFSVAVLVAFGLLLIRTAQMKNVSEMDKVVIASDSKILKGIFSFLEIFFLFGIYVVMTAGGGALLNQLFGVPSYIGNLAFAVIVTAVALIGVEGMVTAFSVTVPLMVIMSVVVFLVNASDRALEHISFDKVTNDNPLIINWFISALVFASYNLFASIGILTPLGREIKTKRTLLTGLICGGVLLFLIAFCILFSLASDTDCVNAELPMLARASATGKGFGYIFAFLLFGGMFGTSVSSVFAIAEYVKSKTNDNKKYSTGTIFLVSVLSCVGSLAGFNNLIGIVYPVCGYLGFIGMVLIAVNYHKSRNANIQEENV